eukprot:1922082-Amphidinium_carterae.1
MLYLFHGMFARILIMDYHVKRRWPLKLAAPLEFQWKPGKIAKGNRQIHKIHAYKRIYSA